MEKQKQVEGRDFVWADRKYAEEMAKKHNGVVIAFKLDKHGAEDWLLVEEFDEAGITPDGYGVTSKDYEDMLDEDETWICVA